RTYNSSVTNLSLALTINMLTCSNRLQKVSKNILNIRRRYHRHHCPHRRCMPLHSRVPFP
uniref:Uncharacterized protein n=1 Tax=Oncorhynchus mykiss TaxID=8022 RepID=A0A8C7RS58_ONCMY